MTRVQLLTIALGGLVTYLVRASFLAFAGRMVDLPPRVTTVLRMIPPAALAALVLPALLRPGGGPLDLVSPILLGGVVATAVAVWRRDLYSPLLAGLAVILAAQPLLG